jgi:predicted regulator of Ras-like GTPase activity (Roadblock/LC7/MglB family)
MTIESILEHLSGIQGVRLVILTGRDGLPIVYYPTTDLQIDATASFGSTALNAAITLGGETRRSTVIGVIFEYHDALISVEPIGDFAAIIARMDTAAPLVPFRQAVHKHRGDLLDMLDTL